MFARIRGMGRSWPAVGLLGLLPLASGCEGDKASAPAGPAMSQEAVQKEQDARRAAYGKSGQPTTTKGTPAPKAAEKPAEK